MKPLIIRLKNNFIYFLSSLTSTSSKSTSSATASSPSALEAWSEDAFYCSFEALYIS